MNRPAGSLPRSLARPLRFDGSDPRHFGAPAPLASPWQSAAFKGAVRLGASCNCARLTLVPHCHGTHTECAGHLTLETLDVAEIAPLGPLPALLLSVVCVDAGVAATRGEGSDPAPRPGDRLVTRWALQAAWQAHAAAAPGPQTGLILRLVERDVVAALAGAPAGPVPPYFSREAMQWIVEQGIEHLVVELPSLDRTEDQGVLCAHRLFFGLPPGGTGLAAATRARATVTELALVPLDLADGPCGLQLAMPRIAGDAVPSQPLWLPAAPVPA
ncbi:MAG: cyclase family protein [Steroidobacteraceae bacterium]